MKRNKTAYNLMWSSSWAVFIISVIFTLIKFLFTYLVASPSTWMCVCVHRATCESGSSSTFLWQISTEVSWSHFSVSIINNYALHQVSSMKLLTFFPALQYSIPVTRPWGEKLRVESSAERHILEDAIMGCLLWKKAKGVRGVSDMCIVA